MKIARALVSVSDKTGVVEFCRGLAALGVRVARKHIGWYLRGLPGGEAFRREAVLIISARAQLAAVGRFFDALT